MINADGCRKKAQEFLQIAQSAPDAVAMRNWHRLADTWFALAEQRPPLELHQSPTTTKRPAELAEKTTLDHKVADLLRERLGLPNVTGAQRPKSSR
jgi:hypothetical protein